MRVRRLNENMIKTGRNYFIKRLADIANYAERTHFDTLSDIFYELDIEPDVQDDVTSEEFYKQFSESKLTELYAKFISHFTTQENLNDFLWFLKYDNGKYTDGSYDTETIDTINYVLNLINKEYNMSLPTV